MPPPKENMMKIQLFVVINRILAGAQGKEGVFLPLALITQLRDFINV